MMTSEKSRQRLTRQGRGRPPQGELTEAQSRGDGRSNDLRAAAKHRATRRRKFGQGGGRGGDRQLACRNGDGEAGAQGLVGEPQSPACPHQGPTRFRRGRRRVRARPARPRNREGGRGPPSMTLKLAGAAQSLDQTPGRAWHREPWCRGNQRVAGSANPSGARSHPPPSWKVREDGFINT